jgi:chemotaxis response regulator CheB
MADWLQQYSHWPVRIAVEGEHPEPGMVLLAGTSDHLVFKGPERLGYTAEPVGHVHRPSVDVFFDSCNRHWHGDIYAALLTGMGRDGAMGMKACARRAITPSRRMRQRARCTACRRRPRTWARRWRCCRWRKIAPRLGTAGRGRSLEEGVMGGSGPDDEPIPALRDDGAIVVFLVDDQAMIGEAVRRALASEKDISFHYCGSGVQAVSMAEQLRPTVILQDLVMPEVDGMALVARYRANAATRDIPSWCCPRRKTRW